jgi:nitrate reductase gamma subunit
MYSMYDFISGPLAWVAFIVFFGGSLYRIISLFILARKKDSYIFSYMSFRYGVRSIFHWIIPFGSVNSRKHPVMTMVTFAFHICLILVPIFLLAHVVLWDESFDISWWALPDAVADVMAIIVIASCGYFLWRRLALKEVKFVTSTSDYVLLAIVAAPFITGFLAYHQWFDYRSMLILHMFAGELMIAIIPFTRLIHMLFFPFTRSYMGSEFGGVRHVKDW